MPMTLKLPMLISLLTCAGQDGHKTYLEAHQEFKGGGGSPHLPRIQLLEVGVFVHGGEEVVQVVPHLQAQPHWLGLLTHQVHSADAVFVIRICTCLSSVLAQDCYQHSHMFVIRIYTRSRVNCLERGELLGER